MGAGVRRLSLQAIAPDCDLVVPGQAYRIEEVAAGQIVLDVGCGFGRLRELVEGAGGTWVGVEPFMGGAPTVTADGMALPFRDGCAGVVVMDAVLEHVPDVSRTFVEVARVLRPGGVFVGYAAFMECFHEISYSHLSFKALEYLAHSNGMVLERLGGGNRFGVDYHLSVLLYPLPTAAFRSVVSAAIRGLLRVKALCAYTYLRVSRRMASDQARSQARLYFQIECLRQSVGFSFVIRKLAPGTVTS